MAYTHFIFDIDGTLVDTEKTGVLSLQKTIRDMMGIEMPYDEVYKFFGIPSSKVASLLKYPQEESFAHTWEQNFIDMRYLMKTFPGVDSMLQSLKEAGIHLGVVTSRSRFEVDNDPIFAGMADLFEVVISAEDSEKHKPEPDPVLAYMRKSSELTGTEVKPQDCIYLGDTMHDYGCGHSAGCDFALADWKEKGMQGIPAEYRFTTSEEILKIAGI